MVQTRRIVARRADVASEADEPILELARRRVATNGGSLRIALRDLREERRQRARQLALEDAPPAQRGGDGSYLRVSRDPRWPFGVENEAAVAPFGLSECGLPRTVDPAVKRNGPRKNALAARSEARDLILSKLQRMGCDPIEIMAEIAMDKDGVKDEVRLRAAAELAAMVYPRLKGVESVQRQEKTVFVIGVPAERPADANSWLERAEGARRIAAATEHLIEGEVVRETTND